MRCSVLHARICERVAGIYTTVTCVTSFMAAADVASWLV